LPVDLKLTLSCKLRFYFAADIRITDNNGNHMDNLQALLIDGTRYDPRYLPSRNADHMPMTLCAISGLGGQLDALIAYRDRYKKKLHEIPSVHADPDWRQGIGRNESYPALLAWFTGEVAEKGIETAVGEYLPEFIGSLAMEAFHPVIRLGYAIDFKSEAETAAALAYMASSHINVPVNIELTIDIRKKMQAQVKSGPRSFTGTGFTRGICELLDDNDYPLGRAADIGDAATVALEIFRSTRDFFALHMVTATHAVRICSQFIDKNLALAALTSGLLAAHQVVGSPGFDRDHSMPINDKLDDEHNYKYAWACLSEYRHYGDTRYLEEIQGLRKNGLIPQWCAADEV
jgi:hypothetical protein